MGNRGEEHDQEQYSRRGRGGNTWETIMLAVTPSELLLDGYFYPLSSNYTDC